jgi:hypothetical protein
MERRLHEIFLEGQLLEASGTFTEGAVSLPGRSGPRSPKNVLISEELSKALNTST